MIKIVFACNDGYFDGLYLSILSIVRRCKKPIQFNLLCADYTELNPKYAMLTIKHRNDLVALVKKYNKSNTFNVIDCTKVAKKHLTLKQNINNKHFSPYASLRLIINKFDVFNDKVLYLDSDTMACGDISKAFEFDLGQNEMCVCHNWWGRRTFAKQSFNSGVILFNMPICHKTHLFDKAIKIFNTKIMTWPDQTAIVKSATKVMFFPADEYRFNRQSEKVHKGDIIKHFCNRPGGWPIWNNIKQWDVKNVHKHLKVFCFDEDYKIWEEYKKQQKK